MHIRPVLSRQDRRSFINLPYQLYRDDPLWIPPLRSEQRSQFYPKMNPLLEHCTWQLFLLEDHGQTVGRIAAFIDNLAVDFWAAPIGHFGYYECPNDLAASRLLLDTACDWLRARGMKTLRGPWSFVSQEWGLVVEGFAPSPVIMAPYNPPYYNDHLVAYGLQKAKDLLCWEVSVPDGYQIPPRILELTGAVAARYKVRLRPLNMRRFDQEVQTIIDLSNASIISNWGYSPVTPAEVQAMARDLKPVLQPKGVIFAEDENGQPIGFAIALPDVNSLLKALDGRLFPFGWLKLLLGLPRLHRYRLFALGVIPAYQGKAVDSLIYRALYEALYTPETWVEINYVLEDNYPMVNAIKKLGAAPLRRYRVYEMEL